MKNLCALILITLSIVPGCACLPTQSEIDNLDYGSYPIDYQSAIKTYFDNILFDPYSAQYEFYEPAKTWLKSGRTIIGGYGVGANVNAKNKMGGYTGKKFWTFFFRDNNIIKVYEGGRSVAMSD